MRDLLYIPEYIHTIYIFIYYILHGSVRDPGFHALRIRQTKWKVFKKRPIKRVNFLFEGEI